METTTFSSATNMRFMFISALNLVYAFLLAQPGTALAQTWKPICVSGGATSGAHNNTWQRVNTTGSGGSTWKKAGGCIASTPPPQSDPPPAILETIDLSGIPRRLYSSVGNGGAGVVYTFRRNGMWDAVEVIDQPDVFNVRSGAYLINGAVSKDYELLFSNGAYTVSTNEQIGDGNNQFYSNRWINLNEVQYNDQGLPQNLDESMYWNYVYSNNPQCPLITYKFKVTIRQIAVPTNSKSADLESVIQTCGR